jgi:hypothetical protein
MRVKERIMTAAEVSDCDSCGRAIDLGEDCWVDLPTGGIWCSEQCAEYAAERWWCNHERGGNDEPQDEA